MATGYDEDGTVDRLICASPPDGGGGGGSGTDPTILLPDEFIPTCFINGRGVDQAITTGTAPVGLSDLAMEIWLIPFGASLARDTADDPVFGSWSFGPGLILEGDEPPPTTGVVIQTEFAWTGVNIYGAHFELLPGWHHYAINFDRNANMTLYADGAAVDAVNINAAVAYNNPAQRFQRGQRYSAIVASGPMAYHHNMLLSGAQMRDSIGRKSVQLLAETEGAWDWRGVTGHTGWDTAPVIRAADTPPGANGWWNFGDENIPNRPIPMNWATPIGVTGEVAVPDLSGNGMDLVLSTDIVYTLAAGTREGCTLGSDPFFR